MGAQTWRELANQVSVGRLVAVVLLAVFALPSLAGVDQVKAQPPQLAASLPTSSTLVSRDEIERKVRADATVDFHATTTLWARVDEVTTQLSTSSRPDRRLVWVATAHGYFLYITNRLDGWAVVSEGRTVFLVYDAETGEERLREVGPLWPIEVIPRGLGVPSAEFVSELPAR